MVISEKSRSGERKSELLFDRKLALSIKREIAATKILQDIQAVMTRKFRAPSPLTKKKWLCRSEKNSKLTARAKQT